jgi:hypothetical protein
LISLPVPTVLLKCGASASCLPLAALFIALPSLAWSQPQNAHVTTTISAVTATSQQVVSPSTRVKVEKRIILRLQLDDDTLSDNLVAYQAESQTLLPLGKIAHLLTLAITVNSQAGSARGYFLSEDRRFKLDIAQSLIELSGKQTHFDPFSVRVIDNDIYVDADLLSRWFPITFERKLPALLLNVKPREMLPLQERLERLRIAAQLDSMGSKKTIDPGYPRVLAPYKLIDPPFIDQTFGYNLRTAPGTRQVNSAYTVYMTADALGMEGAAFVRSSSDKTRPNVRFSLGRNDPEAGLLGPLHARSITLGNIATPNVSNLIHSNGAATGLDTRLDAANRIGTFISTSTSTGVGVAVSNRTLDLPTSFDRQRLRGDLPPGWDVTLYYNDALLGFQSSRADGLYSFDDLPLSFGRNEFQLVFNGPLGQLRTERKNFLLDQSIVKPGEFLYALTQHHADNGDMRSVAQFDLGLSPMLVGSAGFIRMPRPVVGQLGVEERSFTQMGLRAYTEVGILTSALILAQKGGLLTELGFKTRVGKYALDLLHTQLQGGFDSDVFSASGDSTQQQNQLRITGTLKLDSLPAMPLALNATHIVQKSGASREAVSSRVSMILGKTSITNGLNWQRTRLRSNTSGSLQLNRRVADTGLSGQLAYSLKPNTGVDSLALTADRNLAKRYRVNAGLLRTFNGGGTLVTTGLSKDFGRFALAVSSSYSSQRMLAVALQVFVALGQRPRTGEWFAEPLPMASMGAVAARAFIDSNLDGLRGPKEELVPNVGFIINSGGRHPSLTAADGTAFIGQLAPGSYTDIALDPSTLQDPLWRPVSSGVRVLPRPGLVQMLEFPVVSTSEIDGTVYLTAKDRKSALEGVLVELVDSRGAVVTSTTSLSDGTYQLSRVMPGRYALRTSAAQATQLMLTRASEIAIAVMPEGDFISGQDLDVQKSMPRRPNSNRNRDQNTSDNNIHNN